jgi:hypothetical protein
MVSAEEVIAAHQRWYLGIGGGITVEQLHILNQRLGQRCVLSCAGRPVAAKLT